MDIESFNELLQFVYRIPLDRSAWSELCEHLAVAAGGMGAGIRPCSGALENLAIPHTQSIGPVVEAYLRDSWQERDTLSRGYPLLEKKGFYVEQDFLTEQEMAGDPFFTELLAPHDMRWSINVGFQVRSEWWAVSVNRTPKQGPFLPAEWPEMTGLAQHLAGACSMALALRCEHARGFADALHAMKLGAIAIGHDGNVLFVNPTAERLLGDVLDLRGGRLRAITGQNTEVEDLVASMLRPARLSSPPRSLVLKGKGRRSRVALYACRLNAERDIDPVAGSVAGIVVVNDLWERRPVRRDVLKALYRLTNAEVRLVEELVQGRSLKEASERLKIAQETARSYLKGVFFKTGAHRQGELIALVDHISSVPGDPGGRSRGP